MSTESDTSNTRACHAEAEAAPSCHGEVAVAPSCHGAGESSSCHPKGRFDWLLWGSVTGNVLLYGGWATGLISADGPAWLGAGALAVFDLLNIMWWSLLLAIVFVGVLGRIPREFVMSVLGPGDTVKGVARATLAGLMLDLCSHGILLVGAKLYERGASIGQVIAFLVASPWNSVSLTLIMFVLIGAGWTLVFIGLSLLIGILSGIIFNRLVARGTLAANPNKADLPANFAFMREARAGLKATRFDFPMVRQILREGLSGSQMVLRWILFGILLAAVVRAFVSTDALTTYFGASLAGLGLTVLVATIIEICSEGSTPIAADLLTRAHAPGNAFAFLMAGVATDYTEVMVLKETTKSWKIALFLPLVTLPQVLALSWIMNQWA